MVLNLVLYIGDSWCNVCATLILITVYAGLNIVSFYSCYLS